MALPPGLRRADVVGISWYRRSDWPALRALFANTDPLPATFDAWLADAEALEKRFEGQGLRVVRAELRPQKFKAWCASSGRRPDRQARVEWANLLARNAQGDRH
jgi:hypothetical protein